MGSEGRLWAALAKVLAQKKEQLQITRREAVAEYSEEGEVGL